MSDSLSTVIQSWAAQVARAEINRVNVRHFGAVPGQDCTAAFQAAALAAGVNGEIEIDSGVYILSETIQGQTNQIWRGAGCNSTTIKRSGNYGDTFNFANALACSVKGIFFRHGTQFANAAPGPLDYRLTDGSAHIRLSGAQGSIIEDCWMWRMPYGVVIENGSLVKIHRCDMQGTWDHTDTAKQEGIASVLVGNGGYTQIVDIHKCYFGGSNSLPRNFSYTSTDTGAHTINRVEHIGSKNGVRVIQCEDLQITSNYFGSHNASNFATALIYGSVNLDWRITGNFFDGARDGAGINMLVAADGAFVNGVVIADNVFNGEMRTRYGIVVDNRIGEAIIMANFSITGNTFQAFIGSAMLIYHARAGVVSNNAITGYNVDGVSSGGDKTYCAAVYFSKKSAHILCNGNICGGAINTGLPSAFCYHGIVKDASLPLPATIIDSNNLLIQ